MTKYVDIDVIKEAMRMAEHKANYDGCRFDAEYIENVLDLIPAADAVPVTRCRDCANFRQNAHGICWCDEYGGSITQNDYCSRAVLDKHPRASIPWEAD